jgi:hypothetical protein
MTASISPAVAATGGVLLPRRSAGLFLRQSVLATDAEQLGELHPDPPAAS